MSDGTFTTAGEFSNQDLATIWAAILSSSGGGTAYEPNTFCVSQTGTDIPASGGIIAMKTEFSQYSTYAYNNNLHCVSNQFLIEFGGGKTYSQVFGASGFYIVITNEDYSVGDNLPIPVKNDDFPHLDQTQQVFFHDECIIRSISNKTAISIPEFYFSTNNGLIVGANMYIVTVSTVSGNSLPSIQFNFSNMVLANK